MSSTFDWHQFTGVVQDDIRLITCPCHRRDIQKALDDCRDERRPYLFLTDHMQQSQLQRMIVPVSMLQEETYKGEICTYLSRKTGAHIILLQAHDYGSHAKQNTNRIVTLIESVIQRTGEAISYQVMEAQSDSFHVMHEAVTRTDLQADLVILTASREYGLDDWLFGPPERKAVLHAHVPVMLVNPRADLFSLCD